MSLFTKLLIVLNMLGILGVAYLGMMTLSKRQAWAYAVHRHDLVIQGLPLDENDADEQGRPRHLDLTEPTLKEIFPVSPVRTQKEEVDRVKGILDARIAAATQPEQQILVHVDILLPFASTYRDREELLLLHTHLKDAESTAKLKRQLQQAMEKAQTTLDLEREKPQEAIRKNRTFAEAFRESLFLFEGDPKRPFERVFLDVVGNDSRKPIDPAFTETVTRIRDELAGRYNEIFDEAINSKLTTVSITQEPQGQPTETKGTEDLAVEARRRAIARLLLATLDTIREVPEGEPAIAPMTVEGVLQDPNYQRYFSVVGLKEAIHAIDHRALELGRFVDESYVEMNANRSISSELALHIQRERDRFVKSHQTLAQYLQLRGHQIAEWEDRLKRKKADAKAQEDLAAVKEKEVAEAGMALADEQKQTDEKMRQLRQLSTDLYKIRIETRNARELNHKFYEEILRLEENLRTR